MLKYFSIDIEASGKHSGQYSMLSLGAVIIGDLEKRFYKEIQPVTMNYDASAMRIGCLGLHCLDDLKEQETYNPDKKNPKFDPQKVLEHMQKSCETPQQAMHDFWNWIHFASAGEIPVFAASPVKFDYPFVAGYFEKYCSWGNPFEDRTINMMTLYQRAVDDGKIIDADTLGFTEEELDLPHHALEDAIIQAKIFARLFDFFKDEYQTQEFLLLLQKDY